MKRMKGRLLTALMSLAMAFTMMPMMGAPVYADDPHANFTPKYLAEMVFGDFQFMISPQFTPGATPEYDPAD